MHNSISGDITEVSLLSDFDNHTLVSFIEDKENGFRSVIAVHRANPEVPSFGATRLWHYVDSIDGLKDALRLSRGMSYKAALAGLQCGGAKGVILLPKKDISESERTLFIKEYASRVNVLGGNFVTGIDVGVQQEDLEKMRSVSKYIVGFNNNSTEFTALGLYESIRTALKEVFGSSDPSGRSFAIQGLGKVGGGLLDFLYDTAGETSKIFVSDINESLVEMTKEKFPRVIPVSAEEISRQEVDVFVPCALGGGLRHDSIKDFRVKIIAGGANNQLEDESVGDDLHKSGILYAPDYVVNAGGLIAVFDEYKHDTYSRERVETVVRNIPNVLKKIFTESKLENLATNRVANRMAEKIFNEYAKTR